MGKKDPRVDAFIAEAQPFARPILKRIRQAVHAGCPDVEEDIKWRQAAFMYRGILCGMASHKAHVTFGFWDQMVGDNAKAEEAGGQLGRLESVDDLPSEKKLTAMVKDAVARRDAGIKPTRAKTAPKAPIEVPPYFTAALKKNKKAQAAFDAYTPSADARGHDAPSSEAVNQPLGAARTQLHENYIVAQTNDGLILVDQHAAHERIVYERMKAAIGKAGVARQILLIPEIVELDEADAARLTARAGELARFGLAIEAFGPGAVAVRELPAEMV